MKSFEERKEEFLKEMGNNEDFMFSIMSNKDKQDKRVMELLFLPKNERELEVAKLVYQNLSDTIGLSMSLIEGEVAWKPEVSISMKWFANAINEIKSNGKLNKKDLESMSQSDKAELIYDFYVAFIGYQEEALEYLSKKAGYDLEDNISLSQFQLVLDAIKEETDTYAIRIQDDINDDEKLNEFRSYVEAFHKLYTSDENKNKDSDDQISLNLRPKN